MKLIYKIASFSIILGLLGNVLPDSVLDYFHQHEHHTDCFPDSESETSIEASHTHCNFPQLFHEYFIPKGKIVIANIDFVRIQFVSNAIHFDFLRFTEKIGRAPPYFI